MRQIQVDDDEPYVVIEKHEGSVGSFLVGIAIGAGIALLFAPQSGEETRRGIGRGARRVRDSAEGLVEDATGKVTDTFQQARDRVEQRIESARQALETKKQQVSRAMEAGRVAAQQARNDLERRIEETKAAYRQAGSSPQTTTASASAVSHSSTQPAAAPSVGVRRRNAPAATRVAEDAEDTE